MSPEPAPPPARATGEGPRPFAPSPGPDGSIGWWHRHLHRMGGFAARTYFRISVAGMGVPPRGPVLLVANHPNSLLDPALIAVAANRPVRFLAKAPLFESRSLGWLVKGSGSIPIFRRDDDAELLDRNRSSFEAVWDALAGGSAVGIFPEGLSHSEPSLVPLKTGAARIALGAARLLGDRFPIVPVGLTFPDGKDRFRSHALLLVGKPIRWGDLVAGGVAEGEPAAPLVRELTSRIEEGLGRVTVNLRGWEDLPVVESAEAIHSAEFGRGRSTNPVRWLARVRRTAHALERARAEGDPRVPELAGDLLRHQRLLATLGLRPRDLHEVPRAVVAVRWTLVNLVYFGLLAPVAVVGSLVFWPPWKLIRWAEPRFELPPDRRATYHVLAGTAAYGGWVLVLASAAMQLLDWRWAVALLVALPLLGLMTLRIREKWRWALSELRRFLLLKGRKDIRSRLLARQRELAEQIRELQRRLMEPR